MKIKPIQFHQQLTCLDDITGDFINRGLWLLYEVAHANASNAKYILETEGERYFLSSKGKVLDSVAENDKDLEYGARIVFDDMPVPESIDNFKPSWA